MRMPYLQTKYLLTAGVAVLCWLLIATSMEQSAHSTIISNRCEKCADVEAGGGNTCDRLIEYDCHNGDNQQGTLAAVDGAYRIIDKRPGERLTPTAGSGLANAPMVQHAGAVYTNQLLTPAFLLNADGSSAQRPAIFDAPSASGADSTLTVSTDSQAAAFALTRLLAATHSVNNDQRRIPLPGIGTEWQHVHMAIANRSRHPFAGLLYAVRSERSGYI